MGQNWNTPAKSQGDEGSCWAFAGIGSIESQINLYYGKHLEVNLSEQSLVSCMYSKYRNFPITGMPVPEMPQCYGDTTMCDAKKVGIADENCYPYTGVYDCYGSKNGKACTAFPPNDCVMCGGMCSDYQSRLWKINDFKEFLTDPSRPMASYQTILTTDDVKKTLIVNGPLSAGVDSWGHAMELVGYDGKSDWKILDFCSSNKKTCSDAGCFDSHASCNNGDVKNFCVDDPTGAYPMIETYKCIDKKWNYDYASEKICNSDQICYEDRINNPKCVLKGSITIPLEYKECTVDNYYQEYSPGNGDINWIFKNSWGNGASGGGYSKVSLPVEQLGYMDLPIGPFTPPTSNAYWPAGFTNTPSPWFYKQTCTIPTVSPNYTVKMGFTNGTQTTTNLSCPAGQVCQSAVSGNFISCVSPTNQISSPNCLNLYNTIYSTLTNALGTISAPACGDGTYNYVADINKDKVINTADLSYFRGYYNSHTNNETWCGQQLNNTTNPCLLMSQSSLTILSPAGSETWTVGQNQTIKWTSYTSGPASIVLTDNNRPNIDASWDVLNPVLSNGVYSYAVSTTSSFVPGDSYKITITQGSATGSSAKYFSIVDSAAAVAFKNSQNGLASLLTTLQSIVNQLEALMANK